MSAGIFHFRGTGEHDFRQRDPDFDAWLKCAHCNTVVAAVTREGEGESAPIGMTFDCYQEQLSQRDPDNEHSGPVPRSPFTS